MKKPRTTVGWIILIIDCFSHRNDKTHKNFRLNFEGYIDSVKAYSQDITQLGVQWHFTEVTVRTLDEGDSEFMTEEEQLDQAELYSGLMQVMYKADGVDGPKEMAIN